MLGFSCWLNVLKEKCECIERQKLVALRLHVFFFFCTSFWYAWRKKNMKRIWDSCKIFSTQHFSLDFCITIIVKNSCIDLHKRLNKMHGKLIDKRKYIPMDQFNRWSLSLVLESTWKLNLGKYIEPCRALTC